MVNSGDVDGRGDRGSSCSFWIVIRRPRCEPVGGRDVRRFLNAVCRDVDAGIRVRLGRFEWDRWVLFTCYS